jgi:DNA-binding MarR family transcriptional regulator
MLGCGNVIDMKSSKQLERYFKGVSNHQRISILNLISKNPNINVEGITKEMNRNIKTISEHIKKLVQAGLVNKRYNDRSVEHTLSPYGEKFLKFIKTF